MSGTYRRMVVGREKEEREGGRKGIESREGTERWFERRVAVGIEMLLELEREVL